MTEINRLTSIDAVAAGDLLPLYDSSNGDVRKASMSALSTYIQTLLTAVDGFLTQYSAPSATGFTVQITDGDDNVWLILTPAAGYAAGTIKLPLSTNVVNKQEVLVNCTQAITTLTVDGNGATVTGEPSTLSANDFFRLRYDGVTSTWYRVG